ncbi:MAG: hypothetical protein IJ070_03720 [Firmicutes bacterium]|nr:hypothetical protein [Bacillota bacterium]
MTKDEKTLSKDVELRNQEAREHFLRAIEQMHNNAVLTRIGEDGRMETVFVSEEFADMMECSVEEAKRMMSGMSFFKSTNPEDRPLVRSMLRNRVTYDGKSDLTIQKITAKKNRIWVNVHYSFISDFGEEYLYCTYTNVDTLKQHEERLRMTYSSLGLNFYNENEKTLALFRVNLTKDIFEEVKGRDLYDTDSIAFTYSESMRQRSRFFPIASEQEKFIKKFDRENLSAGYVEGKSSVSQVLYSIRKDGKSCFVKISASITRHPLTGELVAFITEQECNSEKVKDTLMGKILAKQFDMVCYLVNGQYGVTIGQRGSISRGNVFPVSSNGSYVQYLTNQVCPVLSGTEDEKKAMRKALEIETIEEKLKEVEPYVVNISIEIDGDVYYKQFDFYSIDPDAKFYILLKSDTTEIQKQHIAINDQLKEALEAANQANVAKTAFLSNMSHEIRTPMNAIIGLNKLALSDSELSDKTRDYLEKIGGSAQHLLGLINDILDMSHIESGRMVLKKEEFHFSEMIEQINTMMNGQCGDKGIKYDCVFTGHVD